MGKNFVPTLSRLCTKVHEILGQYGGPLVISNVLARLSVVDLSEDIRH